MIHMSQSKNFYNERILMWPACSKKRIGYLDLETLCLLLNFVLPLCQIQLQQKRLEVNHVNRSL